MELKIGEKVKSLRLASDLTQEELANRAGMSKGFISQLENDQTSIQIDSLADLLGALGVTLADFFSETGEVKPIYKPEDRVLFENTGISRFEGLVPGSTNNMMDPVFLELKPGETMGERDPHSGEQFGYVLKGTVTVRIDGKTYSCRAKSCFYFKSDRRHQISNEGRATASLIWVVSPPQM